MCNECHVGPCTRRVGRRADGKSRQRPKNESQAVPTQAPQWAKRARHDCPRMESGQVKVLWGCKRIHWALCSDLSHHRLQSQLPPRLRAAQPVARHVLRLRLGDCMAETEVVVKQVIEGVARGEEASRRRVLRRCRQGSIQEGEGCRLHKHGWHTWYRRKRCTR